MNLSHEQQIRERVANLVLDWRTETLGPIENPDKQSFMDMVGYAHVASDEGRIVLGRWIDAARRAGASWADIGDMIGISRQAAQQRFGGQDTVPTLDIDDDELGSLITKTGATAFNEDQIMREQGLKGRQLVGCGWLKLHFTQTDKSWEHKRIISAWSGGAIDEMRALGWEHVTSWYPFHYFRREIKT